MAVTARQARAQGQAARGRSLQALALAVVLILPSWAGQDTRGPLTVCASSPNYVCDNTGRAALLTGPHTWNNMLDMGAALDATAYLAEQQYYQATFVRLWTWSAALYNASYNGVTRSLTVSPALYMRSGVAGAGDGGNKFDLTQLNTAYFTRLRERCVQYGTGGMYVGVMLFEGCIPNDASTNWGYCYWKASNNIQGLGSSYADVFGGGNASILALQRAYVDRVVATVDDLPYVVYEVANEVPHTYASWQTGMVTYLRGKTSKLVLVTAMQPAGSYANVVATGANLVSPPMGYDGTYNFKTYPPPITSLPVVVDNDHMFGASAPAPIYWLWQETPAEGVHFIMGAFARGLNAISMDFHNGEVLSPGSAYALTNQAMREACAQVARVAQLVDLNGSTPSTTLASTGYCLAAPGRFYIVYAPSSSAFTLDLSGQTGTWSAIWYGLRSGYVAGSDVTGGGSRSFTPPYSGACLVLRRVCG